MQFLQDIPNLDPAEVQAFLRSGFGLEGSLRRLAAERDQVFLLREAGGLAWVIKIANPNDGEGSTAVQAQALQHIARIDPSVPVPRVRPALDGSAVVRIAGANGRTHDVYVVSFIEGSIADGLEWSGALLRDTGRVVARLCAALRGFHHPLLQGRLLPWDARRLDGLRPHLQAVRDPRAAQLLERVMHECLPRATAALAQMPSQVLHCDAHPSNVVARDANTVAGIIDFGDMVYGPRVLELACTIADFLAVSRRVADVPAEVAAGYREVSPLSDAEIDIVFDLVQMRLATTRLILGWVQDHPGQEKYYASDDAALDLLVDAMDALFTRGRVDLRRAVAGPAPQYAAASLMERRSRVMGRRPYVFYDPPLHLVRGEGVWLFDAQGRRYLDGYNNVPVVGHCHPAVVAAVQEQVARLNTHTRYLGDEILAYAERLGSMLGDGLKVCTFVNSGSEANDIAWRMARAWSRAGGVLTQEFAYHGVTEAVDAMSPSSWGRRAAPAHVRELLAPDLYRGPHRAGTPDIALRYAQDADRAIESLARAGLRPAAVIVDSAFMANGILEPLPGYLAGVFERVRAAGGLCIADEVQSGFGRMGTHFWGFRHHGVVPDIVTIGKPAGNGFPLGAVITRPEIHECLADESAFFSTFGGNNVAAAAGLAVLDTIEREGLVQRAARVGERLGQGLRALARRHALVGDVRGMGLAYGIELVRDRASLEPAGAEARRLVSLIRDEGLLIGTEGRHGNVLKVRPPMAFDDEHVDLAVGAIDRALARF